MKKIVTLISLVVLMVFVSGCTHYEVKTPQKVVSNMKNIDILKLGDYKIHTFYGISNSHIIETPKSLIVIDMQFKFKLAKALKAYIDTLNKPISKIILSHAHPDHWFGADVFSGEKIVTTKGIQVDLKNRGAEYIKILKPKLKSSIPDRVVKIDDTISTGAKNWDGLKVVLEEYTEQESHHSILIKIPEYGIMIGQDLFYHGMHLVASERSRNKNWAKILKSFDENEAKKYNTILVGHGSNADSMVFNEDIVYLERLEEILESGANMKETKAALIKSFPEKKGQGFINITTRNLFKKH